VGQQHNRKRNKKPGHNVEGGPVIVKSVADASIGTFVVKRILAGGKVTVKWDELEDIVNMGKREVEQR